MKIIINTNGSVTIDVEDYNTEEIAEMIGAMLNNYGIPNGIVYQIEKIK